jgi:hypothetical protein
MHSIIATPCLLTPGPLSGQLIGPIYDRLLRGGSRRVKRFGKDVGRVHEIVIIADETNTNYNWDGRKHSKECGGLVHDASQEVDPGYITKRVPVCELNRATMTR